MQASQYLMTYDDTGHGSLVNTKFRYNTGSQYKDGTGGGANFQCLMDTLDTYPNATVLLDSPVKSIVREGQITGEVQGVILEDGTAIKANRAVILASGGFAGNSEMMHLYDPRIALGTKTSGGTGNTGDMLVAGALVGAQLINMHCIQTDFGGTVKESSITSTPASNPFTGAADYIEVGGDGKRFWTEKNMNEQFMDAEIMALHKAGLTSWWKIGDSNGVNPNAKPEDLETFSRTYGSICNTIEEVAAAIGCDAATLQETINTYNAAVDAQVDNEFGKSKLYLTKKIETPPFYTFEVG
jgi:fumarate reductase flavoprotein subunit